jgi:magnesium-transporting ATPase (P-type)
MSDGVLAGYVQLRSTQEYFHSSTIFPDPSNWDEDAPVCGWMTLIGTLLSCAIAIVALVFAKLLPAFPGDTNWEHVFNLVRADEYFVFVVPLIVVWTVLFVYFNWFSMKIFRHN